MSNRQDLVEFRELGGVPAVAMIFFGLKKKYMGVEPKIGGFPPKLSIKKKGFSMK